MYPEILNGFAQCPRVLHVATLMFQSQDNQEHHCGERGAHGRGMEATLGEGTRKEHHHEGAH